MLNEMQRDLLTELVNVFIGQAASYLSEMVNQKILLTIPEVDLVKMDMVDGNIYKSIQMNDSSHLVSASLKFGAKFNGKAYLIFPSEDAKSIVNACLGEDESIFFAGSRDLQDTDFDVLKEISNVILNAIIGELGNFLGVKLEYAMPEIELVFLNEPESMIKTQKDMYILILHTKFTLSETSVIGKIIVGLGMESISFLVSKLDEELGELHD